MKKLLLGIVGMFLLAVTFASACSVQYVDANGLRAYYDSCIQTSTWNWVTCSCNDNNIPEFGTIAAGVAVLGSGIGFVALRKRK